MTVTYFGILIVAVLDVNGFGDHFTASNGTNPKHIDFVEAIKQNLQRDNDDYKEMTRNYDKYNKSSTLTDKFTTSININHSEAKSMTLDGVRNGRRKIENNNIEQENFIKNKALEKDTSDIPFEIEINNLLPELKSPDKPWKFITTAKKERKRLINIRKTDIKKSNISPQFNDMTHTSKEKFKNKNVSSHLKGKSKKRSKISKFKYFLHKNKAILKNFMDSKLQTETTNAAGRTAKTEKPHKPRAQNHLREKIDEYAKQHASILPKAHMLDMSPAKGGHVNILRLNGRLCHRHVLIPEGPKYDSKGRSYLPAHETELKRPYPATPAPHLLLPRCCNCCKKSVLGCQ